MMALLFTLSVTLSLLMCQTRAEDSGKDSGMSAAMAGVCPEKCDTTHCPPEPKCVAGVVKDECNCCLVCGLEERQQCNKPSQRGAVSVWLGQCGDDMECSGESIGVGAAVDSDNGQAELESQEDQQWCRCRKEGLVCASNGRTYSHCQMAAKARETGGNVTVVEEGACPMKARIVSLSLNSTAFEGDKVTYQCEVEGNPLPTVLWYFLPKQSTKKEAIQLPGDSNDVSVTIRGGPMPFRVSAFIQFTHFTYRYEGDYFCITNNKLGFEKRVLGLMFMSKKV